MGFKGWLGIQDPRTATEVMIAGLGGAISILLSLWLSAYFIGRQGSLSLLPSMGAAEVFLFAAPHSPLTQPWALLSGTRSPRNVPQCGGSAQTVVYRIVEGAGKYRSDSCSLEEF